MAGKPAMQLYSGEWFKSTDLSRCSAVTRGIWIDALLRMHDDDECGELSGTMSELARLCRCSEPEMEMAVSELERTKTAGVTTRDAEVTLTNRRMKSAYDQRISARKRKRKQREKRASDDSVNGSHANVTAYTSSSSSSSSSNKKFVEPELSEVAAYCQERSNSIDAEHFVDHYTARGWILGNGRKMKDWKAAVRTWEKNNFNRSQATKPAVDETRKNSEEW